MAGAEVGEKELLKEARRALEQAYTSFEQFVRKRSKRERFEARENPLELDRLEKEKEQALDELATIKRKGEDITSRKAKERDNEVAMKLREINETRQKLEDEKQHLVRLQEM